MAVAVDLAPVSPSVALSLHASAEVHALRDAARIGAFVAPSKSSTPVLTHLRIDTDAGDLVVSATNLDADVRLRVAAHFTEDGCVLVNAKDFASTLSRAKGDAQLESLGASLVIATSAGQHTLPTLPSADFPTLPDTASRPIATLRGADVARMVRRVAYAQSIDATREHLFGTLVERIEGVLRMVATDGHRMVVARTASPGPDFSVLVHRAAIDTLARVDIEEEPEVLLRLGDSRIHFEMPFVHVSGKVIDAAFPAFQQVVAQASQTTSVVSIERKQLLSALRAIGTGPRDGVRLAIDAARSVVKLSTDDGDGREASTQIRADISGDPPSKIGFAGQYLRQPFESFDEERVSLELSGDLDPMVVAASDGTVAVVMPMRI